MERTPEQTTAETIHTDSLHRPLLRSPLRMTFAVTVLGIASLMQHERAGTVQPPALAVTAAENAPRGPAPFESMHGRQLIGERVSIVIETKNGSGRMIEFSAVRDMREGDLRLIVDGKKFRCDATFAAFGNVSTLITGVCAQEDGNGIVLSSDEHGEAFICRSEMDAVLNTLADTDSPAVTVPVEARFVPRRDSNAETVYNTVNALGSLFGRKKSDSRTYAVPFTREHAEPGQVAVK